jgi:ATPase subunit of ABC transporter with duplicated ATPase domains
LIEPVVDKELLYIRRMDLSGAWDSLAAGRIMEEIQKQLELDSRVVIVGKEAVGQSSFIDLCKALVDEGRCSQGKLSQAEEARPGLVATFSNVPTPQELRVFLDSVSEQQARRAQSQAKFHTRFRT